MHESSAPRAAFLLPKICYTASMTMLDKFVSFAKGLPADRLQSMEATLAALMESYSDGHDFTTAELSEIDRRVSDTNPQFSKPDEITKLFGKPFSA